MKTRPTNHRPFRRRRFTPTPAGMAAIREGLAALYGDGTAVAGDDALALREQLRVEDEARRRRQGELHLAPRDRE